MYNIIFIKTLVWAGESREAAKQSTRRGHTRLAKDSHFAAASFFRSARMARIGKCNIEPACILRGSFGGYSPLGSTMWNVGNREIYCTHTQAERIQRRLNK